MNQFHNNASKANPLLTPKQKQKKSCSQVFKSSNNNNITPHNMVANGQDIHIVATSGL